MVVHIMLIKFSVVDANGNIKQSIIPESNLTANNVIGAIKKYPIVHIELDYEKVHSSDELSDYLSYDYGNISIYLMHKNNKLNAIYNTVVKFIKQNYNNLIMTDSMKKYWSTRQRRQYIRYISGNKKDYAVVLTPIPKFCVEFPATRNPVLLDYSAGYIIGSMHASYSLSIHHYTNYTVCSMIIISKCPSTLIYPTLMAVNNSTEISTFYDDYIKMCNNYEKAYPNNFCYQ